MSLWEQSRVGVSTYGPPKQQDEGLGFVNLIVNPPARLLNAEGAPLILSKQSLLRHLLENVLRQQHVPILIHIVLILL